jgi:hypothetical protein
VAGISSSEGWKQKGSSLVYTSALNSNLAGGIAMKRTNARLATIALVAICSVAYAEYGVIDKGIWPESWPKELDPVRKQAHTYEGPHVLYRHYLIPFTKREEFEAAWPHFLKVKSKGAPIILVRGPRTDFWAIKPAGVLIHSPPEGSTNPEEPIPGQGDARSTWLNGTYIELVVDGDVVDLNRIPLPADTPIVDERFVVPKAQGNPAPAAPGGAGATPKGDGPPAAPAGGR